MKRKGLSDARVVSLLKINSHLSQHLMNNYLQFVEALFCNFHNKIVCRIYIGGREFLTPCFMKTPSITYRLPFSDFAHPNFFLWITKNADGNDLNKENTRKHTTHREKYNHWKSLFSMKMSDTPFLKQPLYFTNHPLFTGNIYGKVLKNQSPPPLFF